MKKRVLSLLLVLCMLLGLLPTAALAATSMGDERPEIPMGDEHLSLPEFPEGQPDSSASLDADADGLPIRAEDELPEVPEDETPASLFATTTGQISSVGNLTISLDTGSAHAHHGDNWNDGFRPKEGEQRLASYDGGTVEVRNGNQIFTKERDRFKNADYLYLPFTLSATVPAHCAITYTFSINLWHRRNSKGGVHYWVEVLDGQPLNSYLKTQDSSTRSANSLGRLCHSNKDGGSMSLTWTVTFDNYMGGTAKTIQRPMAYYVGASKSTSALNGYHHQVESSVTFDLTSSSIRKRMEYDPNDGSGYTFLYYFNDSTTIKSGPTKTGYTFTGWQDTDNTGKVYQAGQSTSSGLDLKAQWENAQYTVYLNAQGGSVSPATTTATYGKFYSLPTPTRTGYTFQGWFTKSSGGSSIGRDTLVSATSNHTLYARWTAKTPTVTLNANGGSVSTSSKKVTYDGVYGALPAPTRTGYTFQGWYTAQTGGTKVESATTVANGENHTLYAHWTAKTVAVSLNPSGGALEGDAGKSVTYDATYGALPTPTRAGYAFTGWYTAASGGSKVESSTKVTNANAHTLYARWNRNTYTVTFNANGGSAVESRKVNAGDALGTLPTSTKAGYTLTGWFSGDTQVTKDTVPTGDVTYTAKWTANQYTVTFDPNGGKVSQTSMTVTYGLTYGTLPTPTRTGYTFDGWFNAPTNGGKVESNDVVTNAADHTLYARWTAQTYTVTYNANGGEVSQSGVSVTYDSPYGNLVTPVRTGYTFDGWYTAPVGGTQVTAATKVTATDRHTLYAHWTANTYTVTFNPNGGDVDTASKSVTFGQTYGDLPIPTRDSYHFLSWNTSPIGNDQTITAATKVERASDHELFAQWAWGNHQHLLGKSKVTFLAVAGNNPLTGHGNYYLSNDLDLDAITIVGSGQTLNLCLNGHKLTHNGTAGSIFVVEDGGKLNICDCNGSHGSHQFTSPVTNSAVSVPGGLITGGNIGSGDSGSGGAVLVKSGGTFSLYSGFIGGNDITSGGSGQTEDDGFGAVRVEGTFHMYGGSICHNKYGCGGGLNICGGEFYLHGGSISYNYASHDDGGAICLDGGTVNIEGGSITDNRAKEGGGGIHVYSGAVNLSGSPVIQNNTTKTGGTNYNIRLDGSAKLTVNEGFSSAKAIGVSSTTAPTLDAPVAVGTAGSGAYARYFLADAAGQEVIDNAGVLTLALHVHPLCGASCGHGDHAAETYTALTQDMLPGEDKGKTLPAGNYMLTEDLTFANNINISSGTVNLCLNGHTLRGVGGKSHCLNVYGSGTLNICDCTGNGQVISEGYTAVQAGSGTTVNLYGGTLSSPTNQCVEADSGSTVTLDGATLAQGSKFWGVLWASGGTVEIKSGEIFGTIPVKVTGSSAVTVSGGTITGDTYGIDNGHSNDFWGSGSVTVTGGTITGTTHGINNAYNNAQLTVSGGTITGTKSDSCGIDSQNETAQLTVSGGAITGGAYGIRGSGVTLSGSPAITGKTADIYAYAPIQLPEGATLEGQFRVVSASSPTEADPVDVTAAADRDYSAHFVAAKANESIRDVANGEGKHTLQLYKKHLHDGEEYENYIPTSKLKALDDKITLQDGGKYLLDGDLDHRVIVPEGATVDLCLNGKNLSFLLDVQGTLNLYDCAQTPGTLCGNQSGYITVGTNGILNWYGGQMSGGKTIYGAVTLRGAMTSDISYLPVRFAPASGVTVTKDAPVIAAKNWTEHMGSSSMRYEQENGKYAVAEVNGDGDLVLRLLRVDLDGVTCYPDYDTGTLTADDLAEPEDRVGYVWDGWYTAEEGGDKVTADTVFSRDATLYPRWTQCDHTANTTKPTVVPPTCTTAGSTTYTCSVCGLEVVTEAPALEHDFETDTDWYKDVDNGTHYHKCSRCEQRQDEAEHTWNGGAVTTQPTAEAEGVMTFTCTVCSGTTTQAIPALVAHSVTYTADDYTVGEAPTQADTVKGGVFSLPTGLTRTGYTLSGWALLDEEGVPGEDVLNGEFTMPDRDVEFQVRWERIPNYALQPGETIVLEDGTVIQNNTDNTVTIDQNGDGTAETTITLPDGGSVTIQEGTDGGKDKVVVPPGAEVTTTPGEGGQGPVITIGNGDGTVDPSGKVEAPVGTTITDKDGNTITITEGEGGTIDPDGVVTFPEGEGGKVTVTDQDGNTVEVEVPGGGDGLDVTPGGVPLVNNPDGTLTIPDGQGGSTTVTVPDGDGNGAEVDDKGNIILPGGSSVTKTDGEGNTTETTVPDQGGAVTPGGDVGPRRPDRELFTVTDIDPEHVSGSIAISGDADKMEWRMVTDPESDWKAVGDTATATLEGLDEGLYQFRYKAEGDLDASLPREIRVRDLSETGGFALTIDPDITGGTVSAVRTHVAAGFEVRLTVKAATDYRLASITVTYEGGEPITPVWSTNTLTYNFTMPSADATVTATFVSTKHTHVWADDWTTSDTHHWHECTADGCDVTANADKSGYGEHVYDNDRDATCNTCGYERTIPGGGTVVTPDNPVDLPGGGTVSKDPDTGDVTITPPEGEGGSTTTITPPSESGDVTVDPDTGEITVPGGSTVKTGEDGPEVTVGEEGGKVDPSGTITVPGGSTVTIPDGQGGETEITVPDGNDADITPTEDGKIEVPEGSTVKKPDGTTVTVPEGGGTIDPATGDVTPTDPAPTHTHAWATAWTTNATHHWHECTAQGCHVTANADKSGYGAHVYDGDQDATCNTCGYERTVKPQPPVVKTFTVTFEAQGGTPTPPDQTVAQGKLVAKPATPAKEGFTFGGWFTQAEGGQPWQFSTYTVSEDTTLYALWTAKRPGVTVTPEDPVDIPGGGTVTKDPDSGDVTIIPPEDDPNGSTIVITPPSEDGDVTVDPDSGEVTVPPGSTVDPGNGGKIELPDGGKVDGEGNITLPDGGDAVTVPDGEGGSTTITAPDGGGTIKPDPDGGLEVPGGSTIKTGEDGPEVTVGEEGGKVDPSGTITVPGGSTVTIPDGNGDKTEVTVPEGGDATIKPTEDGKVEIPGGSTVTVPDGKGGETQVTVPDEGGKVTGDGTVTVPGGSTVTIPDGKGGETEVTVPEGGDATIKPTEDGKIEVPAGSTIKKPGGTTVTVPEGGGTIDPATGEMTPAKPDEPTPPKPSRPSGSSSTSNKPSVSAPGKGGAVTADRDGNVTITPDQGYQIDKVTVNGKEVTVPEDGKLTGLKRTDKVVVTFKEVPAVTVDRFTDVKSGDWFYDSVKDMVEQGLMNGTGEATFAPGLDTSRAMIATIIWRLAGSPETEAELNYPDCVRDSWYAKAVAWGTESGVLKGYDTGDFGPDDPITREQMALMLWRYTGQPTTDGTLDAFTDADKAGSWAAAALRWAVEQGVLQGRGGGVLDPAGQATRAEAAAMLARYLKNEK